MIFVPLKFLKINFSLFEKKLSNFCPSKFEICPFLILQDVLDNAL